MRCLVPVKRVIDFNVKIRLKPDGSNVETDHVKMSMNPFDEIALEEAQRLKEKNIVTHITAVSIGTAAVQETLRVALARGADEAVLIEVSDLNSLEPLEIAKILKHCAEQYKTGLVIMGKQAIDDDCNQTGQMLAALLGWSQGTFASQLIIDLAQKTALVTREVDGGTEQLKLELPSVITTDLRLNEPRYISLPNVMQAKKKQITVVPLASLGLSLIKHHQQLKVEQPVLQRTCAKVKTVEELVQKLHSEAKVI